MTMRIFLGATLALSMIWGCGSSKGTLLEQLGRLQQEVHALERKASGDAATLKLVQQCRLDLQRAEDLLVEGNTDEAKMLLEQIQSRLSKPDTTQETKATGPLSIEGTATWLAFGQDRYQTLTENVSPREIQRIRSGIRSAVHMELGPISINLPGQSEIIFNKPPSKNGLDLELIKGNLSMERKSGSESKFLLEDLKATMTSSGALDLANHKLTNNQWLALYRGELSWQAGDANGSLSAGEGLVLSTDKTWSVISLPLAPHTSHPADQQTVNGANVVFRWLGSPDYIYQIQVSKTKDFKELDYDRIDLKGGEAVTNLPPGAYLWRVRGFAKGSVPGPFSAPSLFTVEQPGENANKTDEPPQTRGPYIRGLDVEVISDTVIVTGRTKPGSRISVNGTTAMVEEDGSFRAIINFTSSGLHKVITKSVSSDSGAETVVEKKVKIHIR